MDYKIYEGNIEIIEDSWKKMTLFFNDLGKTIEFSLDEIKRDEPFLLGVYGLTFRDCILVKINHEQYNVYLYCLSGTLYLVKEEKNSFKEIDFTNPFYFPIELDIVDPNLKIKRVGILRFLVFLNEKLLMEINDNFFVESYYTEKIDFSKKELDLVGILLIIRYKNNLGYLTKDNNESFFKFSKIFFDILEMDKDLELSLVSPRTIEFVYGESFSTFVDIRTIISGERKKICEKEIISHENKNMLAIFVVNKTRYYLFLKQTGVYIQKGHPEKATKFTQNLKSFSLGKNIYIFGTMLHRAYNSTGKYDYLYSSSSGEPIGQFFRPFKKIKYFKKFGFYKLKFSCLDSGTQVHYPIWVGNENLKVHRLTINTKKISWVYSIVRAKAKVLVLRSDIHGKSSYSIVPDNPMYSLKNRIKQKIAFYEASKERNKKVNLYFEKMASKADESGFRVFEAVMKSSPNDKCENYYILDKSSASYPTMKEKYGENIVERFSYRHYKLIFQANYFISSDLSNHVLSDRIYINSINQKLKEVPLIFLQHGIMFAKPVENPLGKIFYKKYAAYNVYKNVVNSQLEAFEFYKMGYSDFDLIKTGLATFDYAKLDFSSDKIVYMPTYRYWEEGMIYSGDIKKTTYYKSMLRVISLFEEAGLIDRLVLVSHNKFADYIVEHLPKYKENFAPNPSVALGIGRIFISDYSSAIYDAIYRGAYPIFYWEDKEYLIKNYKATPPVNEMNAPGAIVYSGEELMKQVVYAIKRNYKMEKENQKKYKKINEFDDNKNTERIIKYMKNDHIL
ncbi:MAG: CDP-glycerol glycerophosphotransferase family protein [Carnobacterium maltaromaticum]